MILSRCRTHSSDTTFVSFHFSLWPPAGGENKTFIHFPAVQNKLTEIKPATCSCKSPERRTQVQDLPEVHPPVGFCIYLTVWVDLPTAADFNICTDSTVNRPQCLKIRSCKSARIRVTDGASTPSISLHCSDLTKGE